jgi:type I restriction enzyme M protein
MGQTRERSADVLGHVFEYFLGEFALAEGKKGGQFYTPKSVVKLLVEMLEPYQGRVFDPCRGSGSMFVQSEKFVAQHKGRLNDISIYGQESNQTTWRLAKMNLAIRRGLDNSQVRWNNEGSFLNDLHKDLKADFVIANPPFNDSDWSGDLLRGDARWKLATRPAAMPTTPGFSTLQEIEAQSTTCSKLHEIFQTIEKTTYSYLPGLFYCYDLPDLPPTDTR